MSSLRRSKKMPVQVLYNFENMVSPRGGDPKTNIYIRAGDKDRISRDRLNVSPSGALNASKSGRKDVKFGHRMSQSRTNAHKFNLHTDSV